MVDIIKNQSTDAASNTRRRWPWLALLLLLAAGAAGVIWFLGGEAPDEVDLEETASAITATTTASELGPETTANEASPAGIEGVWAVNTGIGEFTVDGDSTATFAGFRVAEVLASMGSTTAVGRTPTVTGSITIEETTLTAAEIVADLTKIVSNESRRESAIQRTLGTSANPNATFVLTSPVELGVEAAEGQPVSVTALGELTINGVTNSVEIALEAQLVEGSILVTGSLPVVFADYSVETPTAPVVVSVEDNGTVEMQVWFSAN